MKACRGKSKSFTCDRKRICATTSNVDKVKGKTRKGKRETKEK